MIGQYRGKRLFAGQLFAGRLFGPIESAQPFPGAAYPGGGRLSARERAAIRRRNALLQASEQDIDDELVTIMAAAILPH